MNENEQKKADDIEKNGHDATEEELEAEPTTEQGEGANGPEEEGGEVEDTDGVMRENIDSNQND